MREENFQPESLEFPNVFPAGTYFTVRRMFST
jgi:hypothetical protein